GEAVALTPAALRGRERVSPRWAAAPRPLYSNHTAAIHTPRPVYALRLDRRVPRPGPGQPRPVPRAGRAAHPPAGHPPIGPVRAVRLPRSPGRAHPVPVRDAADRPRPRADVRRLPAARRGRAVPRRDGVPGPAPVAADP